MCVCVCMHSLAGQRLQAHKQLLLGVCVCCVCVCVCCVPACLVHAAIEDGIPDAVAH